VGSISASNVTGRRNTENPSSPARESRWKSSSSKKDEGDAVVCVDVVKVSFSSNGEEYIRRDDDLRGEEILVLVEKMEGLLL